MNKYLIAAVMVVLVAAGGYSQRGEAAPCPIAPFSTYTAAAFTCDIQDKTFSAFTLFGATDSVTVGQVTPVVPPNIGNLYGFMFFTGSLSAITGGAASNDISFGYTVTCNGIGGPFNCIDSVELSIVGSSTGTGLGTVDETITGCGGCAALHVAT